MTPWTAPEGMVACEVGPVEMRFDTEAEMRVRYECLVGWIGRTYGTLSFGGTPVYRPCDEEGNWLD